MRSSISAARALFMLRKDPPRSSFDSPKEAESLCGISSFDSPKDAVLRASPLRASPEDFGRSSFDSRPLPLSVDEALERAGGWSAYQRRLMLWLGLGTATCAVHMLQPIFLLPLIDWELTATERGLMTTCFFADYALGVLPWAHVSDRRGRRPTIIVALLIAQAGGVGSFLAPSLGPSLAPSLDPSPRPWPRPEPCPPRPAPPQVISSSLPLPLTLPLPLPLTR